jgi:hypothetical protein
MVSAWLREWTGILWLLYTTHRTRRRQDREQPAAVSRQVREAMFTAYADQVMEDIYLKVMAETVYDQEADQ